MWFEISGKPFQTDCSDQIPGGLQYMTFPHYAKRKRQTLL